jgi:hypothetical protein
MTQQDHWKDTLWPTIAVSGETLVSLPGTTSVIIPVGSTAERPASPTNGMMRFNTDLGDFEAYNGVWAILATLAGVTLSKLEDGDLNTEIYVENFTGVDDNIIAFTMGDNSGTYTMPASVLNWSTSGFGITTPTGASSNTGVGFTVTTGDGNVAAAGGTLNLITGDGGTNGNGGDIGLLAGAAGASAGNGGSVVFAAGDAAIGLGGLVSIAAGDSGSGNVGGAVTISGGVGTAAAGGAINLNGGASTTGIGGEINITTGISVAASGAPINLTAGAGDGATNSGGAISITGGEGAINGIGGAASVIGGAGGATTGDGGVVNILGGQPQLSGAGGNINMIGGDALGIDVGGAIELTAGTGGTTSGVGGALLLNAGAGGNGDIGGAVTITSGSGSGSGDGGGVAIIAGDGGGGGGEVGGNISAISGAGAGGSGSFNISTANVIGVPAGDITLTAGTGSPHSSIKMVTGGAIRFTVVDDGTLSSSTASYETLVLADNDMPNKKYVDDGIAAIGPFLPLAGGTMTGAINAGAFAIGNVLDPVAAQDAATMNYVDTEITAALHPYDLHAYLGFALAGAPAGTNVYRWTVPRAITLGTGGHYAYCDSTATASVAPATFNLHIVSPGGTAPGASIGTITFAIGSLTGVVAALGPVVLAAGEELILTYTTPDTGGTLAAVVIGLLANV